MEREVVSLLCDPDSRFSLQLVGHNLRNTVTRRTYPIYDGIPLFVSTVSGPNLKRQILYNMFAPVYDLAQLLSRSIFRRPDCRREYLNELEIQPGDRVLEVAVGTGANLRHLPQDIELYGIDISWGMLRRCQRNLERWRRRAYLFHSVAERLPFSRDVFDCVFHVGGINHFTDKTHAIREMIWVAKPGAKIVIVDRAEKKVRVDYQRNPATRQFIDPGANAVDCLLNLIPNEMQEIKAKEICHGKLFCLTFRKPGAPQTADPQADSHYAI